MIHVPPKNAFPAVRKICRIFTCFYVGCPNTRLIFTRVHPVGLLSSNPLGRSLESSNKRSALFRTGEIFAMDGLEFPVLLDKSVDHDGVVIVRCPEGGSEHNCDLYRDYAL